MKLISNSNPLTGGFRGSAKLCNKDGTIWYPNSPSTITGRLLFGRPGGTPAGYFGMWFRYGGGHYFLQGRCVDEFCDQEGSILGFGQVSIGYVNQEYELQLNVTDVEDVRIVGLPGGLSFDASTNLISGIPTQAGNYPIIISGITTENECEINVPTNLRIDPCDPVDSIISIGMLPIANEFEEWEHVINFTDVEEIQILGLPNEITATVDEEDGTITLESEELPATSTYTITVKGKTTEHECPIEVEFILRVLPCDSLDADASISAEPTWRIFRDSQSCCVGVYGETIVNASKVENIEITGLPSWLSTELISENPQGSQVKISGSPNVSNCEFAPESIAGGTEQSLGTWIWNAILEGETIPNGCRFIRTIPIRLVSVCIPSECPSPTDYGALGASILPIFTTEPRVFTKSGSFGNQARFMLTNCDWENATISGLPEGIYRGASNVWNDSNLWFTGIPLQGVSNGIYTITISTTVIGGIHAGCDITLQYQIQVVD
jgi:hypothetical protein